MSLSWRDESLDVVHHLTMVIGPRAATSLAEAQAAAYIDGRLRRAGMRVSADPFRAPLSLGLNYALLALPGVFAGLLAGWFAPVALLLALLGLVLVLADGLLGPLPPLAPHHDSQNVVGTRESEKLPRWRVVLLAPLDAPGIADGGHWLSGVQRFAVLGRGVAYGLLCVLNLALLLDSNNRLWWYAQALPAAYLALALLPFQRKQESTPANGGAAALAVLLAAAERLTGLQSVELWTVALGATATGRSGLSNLLARYPFPRETTLLIGLETVSEGQLTYASREGVLRSYTADALLVRLANEADAADPLIDVEPRPYRTAPSLLGWLHARGYRALTVLTRDALVPVATEKNGGSPSNSQILDRATRLVVTMIRRLDGSTALEERVTREFV